MWTVKQMKKLKRIYPMPGIYHFIKKIKENMTQEQLNSLYMVEKPWHEADLLDQRITREYAYNK